MSVSALSGAVLRTGRMDVEAARPWIQGARSILQSADAHEQDPTLLDCSLRLLANAPYDPDEVDPEEDWETLQPVLELGVPELDRISVRVAQHRFPEHAHAHELIERSLRSKDVNVRNEAICLAWFNARGTQPALWLDRMLQEKRRDYRGDYLLMILGGRDVDPAPDIREGLLAQVNSELESPDPAIASSLYLDLLDWYEMAGDIHPDWDAWALGTARDRSDRFGWQARTGLAAHGALPADLLEDMQSGSEPGDDEYAAHRRGCLYLHALASGQHSLASQRLDDLLDRDECGMAIECHSLDKGHLTGAQKARIVQTVNIELYAYPTQYGSWELLGALGAAWHARLPELEQQFESDRRRIEERREMWYPIQSLVQGLQILIDAARS